MTGRSTVVMVVLALGLQTAATAFAQTSISDKAAAEGLFDQGLALMRESKFKEACMRLEQSQTLEHGIGTMLYLAECYEHVGRIASSWALFREASSEARAEGQLERAQIAAARASEIEPRLAKLAVETSAGAVLPGMVFSIDGTARPSGMWGVQLPIDPGEHQVEVKAPGYQVWSTVATVPPEQTLTVTIPALTPQPASEAAVAAAPSTGPRATEPAPEAPVNSALQRSNAPAHRSTLTKALAFSLGGAGIAALAVATGFGVRAIHKNNDAKDFCPADGGNGCTQRGLDLTDDSRSAARLSTGLTVAGALLAVGGVAIYFYHPWEKAPRVALKSDGRSASLLLGGAF